MIELENNNTLPQEVSMEFKKILWPTDFSPNAEKALPYVQSLTRQYNAEIHVLYVAQDIVHHESCC